MLLVRDIHALTTYTVKCDMTLSLAIRHHKTGKRYLGIRFMSSLIIEYVKRSAHISTFMSCNDENFDDTTQYSTIILLNDKASRKLIFLPTNLNS